MNAMRHGGDDMNWYQYQMAHFDALPAKVRDAVRKHPEHVDCDLLSGKTVREALRMLAAGEANSPGYAEAAVMEQGSDRRGYVPAALHP